MPNPTLNLPEWRNRWVALKETMTDLLKAMTPSSNSPRHDTLAGALTALQAFGDSQMEFFLKGFDPKSAVRLEPSTTYPPEYALRMTLDHLAQDMDVITRAWQQRLPQFASPKMISALAKADALAYQALLPAIEHEMVPPATVVTYFQKATTVRLIPYAPVIFIGLPITIITASQDLLAVPHEVGHYVYRYGQVPPTGQSAGSRFPAALAYRFADKPAWCMAWLEEIFADVYGALIGGPAMTMGFEALVTDDPAHKFTEDDGEHPVAALRPKIYHTVFQELGGFERVRMALVNRWESRLAERGKPTSFKIAESDTQVRLDEAQPIIDSVIVALLKNDLAGIEVKQRWSSELADGASLDTLQVQFDAFVNAPADQSPTHVPDLEIAETKEGRWLHLRVQEIAAIERKVGETGLWIDAIKAAEQDGQRFNMSPEVWIELLDGSGWATEGPEGGSPHLKK